MRAVRSLISIDTYGASLTLRDTKFQHFYFPYGLITNLYNPRIRATLNKRNFFDEKTWRLSSGDASVRIDGCTFDSSLKGNFGIAIDLDDTHYGAVLSMYNFAGDIQLNNNTFT